MCLNACLLNPLVVSSVCWTLLNIYLNLNSSCQWARQTDLVIEVMETRVWNCNGSSVNDNWISFVVHVFETVYAVFVDCKINSLTFITTYFLTSITHILYMISLKFCFMLYFWRCIVLAACSEVVTLSHYCFIFSINRQ